MEFSKFVELPEGIKQMILSISINLENDQNHQFSTLRLVNKEMKSILENSHVKFFFFV